MIKSIVKAMIIAACVMAVTASAVQAEPESLWRQSVYGRAVSQGFCPIGLVCPSYKYGVKPAISRPGHLARLRIDGAPPYRIVQLGETLWGIAQHYLSSGPEWKSLCWFYPDIGHRQSGAKHLQVGEVVYFC